MRSGILVAHGGGPAARSLRGRAAGAAGRVAPVGFLSLTAAPLRSAACAGAPQERRVAVAPVGFLSLTAAPLRSAACAGAPQERRVALLPLH